MRDWLEDGHLAFFVLDVIASMDSSALHLRPGGCPGRPPYEPEMMSALLLYGYCTGVRSSRRIEAGCRTDAAFRVISGGLVPDHATVARFVVDHEQALAGLFVEGIRLCAAAGLADLRVLAVDGTKIAADAALDRNRGIEWIRREIAKLMEITAKDAGADIRSDGVPSLLGPEQAEIITPRGRKARLRAALAVIDAENLAAATIAQTKAEEAVAQAAHGRFVTGRKPKDPLVALGRAQIDVQVAIERVKQTQALHEAQLQALARGDKLTAAPKCRLAASRAVLTRAQDRLTAAEQAAQTLATGAVTANVTDADSRIMKTKDGFLQGYNAQAVVNEQQIVLGCDVSQSAADQALYLPMVRHVQDTLTNAGIAGEIELMLADAGYWSEQNATSPGPDRLIATQKDHKQRVAARQLGHTDGPPPPEASTADQMEHLLRTPQGAAAYRQRSCLIEPVFGDRKHNRQFRSFRRRGLDAARAEWAFIHLAGNMLKLYQHRTMTVQTNTA
jgi:transposase